MSRTSQHEASMPEVRRSSHKATVAVGASFEEEDSARTRPGARFPVVAEGSARAGVVWLLAG